MPWFDRALKSVQGTAEKAAFEADKMVRVHREESMLGDLQNKSQVKLAELGQAALALYRSGAVSDPAFAGLAQEIADLEAQVQAQQAKVEAVRTEQWQAGGQPGAPVAAHAPLAPDAPAAPVAAQAPSVPDAPAAGVAAHAPSASEVPAAPASPVAAQAPEAERMAPPPVVSAAAPSTVPAMVECPNCHTQVKPTAAFCPECGNKMH